MEHRMPGDAEIMQNIALCNDNLNRLDDAERFRIFDASGSSNFRPVSSSRLALDALQVLQKTSSSQPKGRQYLEHAWSRSVPPLNLNLLLGHPTLTPGAASLYLKKGQAGQAVQAYSSAIKIHPNQHDFYFNRGNAYQVWALWFNKSLVCSRQPDLAEPLSRR